MTPDNGMDKSNQPESAAYWLFVCWTNSIGNQETSVTVGRGGSGLKTSWTTAVLASARLPVLCSLEIRSHRVSAGGEGVIKTTGNRDRFNLIELSNEVVPRSGFQR